MQDLAAFVTQRLPTQSQRSVHTLTVNGSAHPAVVAQDQQDITETLAGLVRDVLGVDVPLHQPFMAASLLILFSLHWPAVRCSSTGIYNATFSHQQSPAIVSADCLSVHSIAPRDLTGVMACISRSQAVES